MAKLKENEVQVGQTKIGPETVIQMNLKTLVIVLGFVLSGLTTAWVTFAKCDHLIGLDYRLRSFHKL